MLLPEMTSGFITGGMCTFRIHNGPCLFVCLLLARQPPVGHGLLIHEVSRSHNDASQPVGLLWMSDQPVAETTT